MSTINGTADVSLHELPDYIKEDLDMIVVGLNPSLTSAQIGHYFAGPGNHFWSCVSEVGLVSEPVTCYDDSRMIDYGIGFTNACSRATKGAADLSKKEMKDGMKLLLSKLQKYTPKIVVFNGKGTYEIFVRHKHFGMGKQPQRLEGTNSVVFVMPSSSARCAQLPRAADKIPFFSALKDLRDKIKIWSNGLSTGGRLVPLEETVITSMFPDHIDLELTRLYDAGKSNYSTDRAEKKRKANIANGGTRGNLKTSSSEDSSQGSASGINHGQQLSKTTNFSRNKEERLPTSNGPNFFMSNQAPSNGQWVAGAFYNSSFSYQQYLLDSSSQYSSSNFCRYPSFRSSILPNNLPPTNTKVYPNLVSGRNSFSSLEERSDHSFDNTSFQDQTIDNVHLKNNNHDSNIKTENINQKNNAKENCNSQPQASTNFVSLLMSDSVSVPGSPCENERPYENRFNPSISAMNWHNDQCGSTDSVQCNQNSQNSIWEQNNNNFLVSSYFGSRRVVTHEQPMTSMYSSFQSNMTNYDDIQNENHYQSPFPVSGFYASPTSLAGTVNSLSSAHSPLSSDQVTSSLCSVKVTPDSTSLANQKRYFNGPNFINTPNKVLIMDDNCNHNSDHVSLTYTDL